MNYPAAKLRGIKMNFYLFNPDAEHRGILLIKIRPHPFYLKPYTLYLTPLGYALNPFYPVSSIE